MNRPYILSWSVFLVRPQVFLHAAQLTPQEFARRCGSGAVMLGRERTRICENSWIAFGAKLACGNLMAGGVGAAVSHHPFPTESKNLEHV